MSRQKVTIEAVRLAIQALHDAGKTPSINQILTITGGSKSTVAAMMREINAEADGTGESTALQPAVLAAMERFASEIWQVADAAAKAQFEAETRRYLARTKASEDQITELAAAADNADEERDVALKRIADLEARIVREQQDRIALEARIRELEADRSQAAKSLAVHIERLEEAREQLEVSDTINEELQGKLRLAEQEADFARREAKHQAEMLVRFEALWDSLVTSQAAKRPLQIGATEAAPVPAE